MLESLATKSQQATAFDACMSVERVRAFAQAAKEFYLASPWHYLSDSDLVVIESPKPPKGMSCFVVLGAGRSAFGLGIYPNRKAYEKLMQAGRVVILAPMLTLD